MSIDVSGGAGGTAAELDDLDAAAWTLDAIGQHLLGCAGRALATGASPALAEAAVRIAVRAPHLAAAAGAAVAQVERHALGLVGATGAGGEAAALALLASTVREVVGAYRAADRAAVMLVRDAEDLVMSEVGMAAPALLLGLGAIGLTAFASPAGRVVGPAQVASLLDEAAYRVPWAVDLLAGGSDALLRGLAADPMCAIVLVAASYQAGVVWPPGDEREATAVLEQVGAMAGALDESVAYAGVSVTALPRAADLAGHAPTGLAGLLTDAVDLGDPSEPGRVRVTRIPQPDGSSAWVVQVPGTQDWDPRPGGNPFDLSTDVSAMTGAATLAAVGTRRALEQAMAAAGRAGATGRDDPVLLSGHSQGGIISASLASDPAFRASHPRLQIVTAGSPIAGFPIPPSVPVLSLEHVQDPVPRLDGSANPDRPTWTTVRADLRERGAPVSAGASHGSSIYLTTAEEVDGAIATHESASLDAWARGAAPFFGGDRPAQVTDFRITRLPTEPLSSVEARR